MVSPRFSCLFIAFWSIVLLRSFVPAELQASPQSELGDMFSDIDEHVGERSATREDKADGADVTELDRPVTDLLESSQKRKFSGWGSYTYEFKELCSSLAIDGRDQQLKLIVDRYLARETECPACYPLMKIVSHACTAKKLPKVKKGKKDSEETPAAEGEEAAAPATPALPVISLQREPNMKVEYFIESLLMRLAEDASRRDEGMIALKQLSTRLVSAKYQQLPGERDYFGMIQGFMNEYLDQQEIFREKQARKAAVDDGIHIGGAPKESVDDLFN